MVMSNRIETPETPRVSKDGNAIMLEDVLDLVFGVLQEYDDRGGCGADDCMVYLKGVKDTFEAINGPIIR